MRLRSCFQQNCLCQAAGKALAVEGDLGTQAIVEMASECNDEERLQLWIRAGLNGACLGAQLQALCSGTGILEQWYDR